MLPKLRIPVNRIPARSRNLQKGKGGMTTIVASLSLVSSLTLTSPPSWYMDVSSPGADELGNSGHGGQPNLDPKNAELPHLPTNPTSWFCAHELKNRKLAHSQSMQSRTDRRTKEPVSHVARQVLGSLGPFAFNRRKEKSRKGCGNEAGTRPNGASRPTASRSGEIGAPEIGRAHV